MKHKQEERSGSYWMKTGSACKEERQNNANSYF